MTILIIGFAKIKYMPYANFYLDNIDKVRNEVHFLYWNRDQKPEDLSRYTNVIFHEFDCYQKDQVRKHKKIINFLKFKNYAKKIIKAEKIDFIIVMESTCAVVLNRILIRRFPQKFIFDYRDSSYESWRWYYSTILEIEKKSKNTFVSSDGFRKYFPDEEQKRIITTHNILLDSLNHRDEHKKNYTTSEKIRIGFWGFVRELEINIKMIDKIGCDNRFELHFYGKEEAVANLLKKHVTKRGLKNIYFHGEYAEADRYYFARNTDLIHNTYDSNNMRIAMSNKFYDGLIFRIPQIINANASFMGGIVTRYGVGLEVCPEDDAYCDKIYDYYHNLNRQVFDENCDNALREILDEYNKGCLVISDL